MGGGLKLSYLWQKMKLKKIGFLETLETINECLKEKYVLKIYWSDKQVMR